MLITTRALDPALRPDLGKASLMTGNLSTTAVNQREMLKRCSEVFDHVSADLVCHLLKLLLVDSSYDILFEFCTTPKRELPIDILIYVIHPLTDEDFL